MKQNIEEFLKEYKEICEKYNIILTPDDPWGGFEFDEYDEKEMNMRINSMRYQFNAQNSNEEEED